MRTKPVKLHKHLMFVGDKPNPGTNRSLEVAFVGSKSYKTLLEWMYRMDVDVNLVTLRNAHNVDGSVQAWMHDVYLPDDVKIISLGIEAYTSVCKMYPSIRTFSLPHPSGLNQKINDKKKISDILIRCRKFIYSD